MRIQIQRRFQASSDAMAVPSAPVGVFTGWRLAGLFNTILIWLMSIILTCLLFTSAWRLGSGWSSITGTTMLFQGDCSSASRTNLLLHVALNSIATLVLASSNSFMQVLCAPTRSNVDSAHRRHRYVDIGVQSVRNLFFIPRFKVVLWLLLAATSVPLHLYFNSALSESKASTDMFLFVTTETFLSDNTTKHVLIAPGIYNYLYRNSRPIPNCRSQGPPLYDEFPTYYLPNITANATRFQWKNMTIDECLSIYDDPGKSLTLYRHAIMVVRNESDPALTGWEAKTPTFPTFEERAVQKTVWQTLRFQRTDKSTGDRLQRIAQNASYAERMAKLEWLHKRLDLDPKSGIITINSTARCSTSPPATFKAAYCLAEPWVAPCEIHVQNTTLIIVCVFCIIKAVVCLISIIMLRHDNPLITPGDAIESFITKPDPHTEDMCWASRRPERIGGKWWVLRGRGWARGARQWEIKPRRLGSVVPWYIWVITYAGTGYLMGSGLYMTILWWRNWQPW